MLFFTVDGGMIAGLTVSTWDVDLADSTLRRLAATVDALYGYTLWEQPPPDRRQQPGRQTFRESRRDHRAVEDALADV